MKPELVTDPVRTLMCIFCLCIFSPAYLQADPVKQNLDVSLTLERAKVEALAQNFEILAAQEELNAAAGQVTTAKTWENPELSVGPSIKRVSQSDAKDEQFIRGSAELNQLILFPGKRALQVALAEHGSRESVLALEGLKHQIYFKVQERFYALLAAIELLRLRASQVQSAKVFSESSRKRAESGYGSDVDVVRGEAELIKSQKLLSEADAQTAQARAALNTLLGRSAHVPLVITGDIEGFRVPVLPGDLTERALTENPAYKARIIQAKKAGLNVEVAKLSRAPDFRFGPFVEYGKDEQIYGLGVSLPLTLWDTKSGAIASATAEQRKELAEVEKLRLEIIEAVTTALSNLRAAEHARDLYHPKFLSSLKDSMNRAEKAYATSGTTVLIYLDAKRTYFETTADYYETLGKLPGAYSALESALGVPFNNQ